ncbi:unnamed protein product [Zymoseptoria tritici ST99CH_1A5]|uniref:Uncharacterized protein n=3 Tax=Zymoseptoria tritici TaxID=1047171 RepID=A0A1X7S210_ZYMT9|nr:unnamed protein product [Zymoseptoria tritici ST99CH_3D7]SMR57295.1 unnamed protein product [Zymoseptoria tritici ST99CH_1E4]SMY27358.1 unnamed protein product [Zymoseptoria tritici ST99CH_1A5]
MANNDDMEMTDAIAPASPSPEASDNNASVDVPATHPPIYARMKSTRRKGKPTPRPKIGSIFKKSGSIQEPDEDTAPPPVDPRFAVETPFRPVTGGFKMPLRPLQPNFLVKTPLPAPTTSTQVYSNEAQVYHARHASLLEDHENQRYHQCEQGCLALLLEPRVPHYTRIQVLQLLATIWAPSGAERLLHEAEEMLDAMDGTLVRVKLLKDDNTRMLADLNTWRAKHGLVGDLEEALEDQPEGAFGEDQAPVASYYDLDHAIQDNLDEELDDGLAHVGGYKADGRVSSETDKEKADAKQKAAEELYD